MSKFIVFCRFQYHSSVGVEWTKWFPCNVADMTEAEAIAAMQEMKDSTVYLDQKTKLKHEFEVRESSEFVRTASQLREKKKGKIMLIQRKKDVQ